MSIQIQSASIGMQVICSCKHIIILDQRLRKKKRDTVEEEEMAELLRV